MVLADTSVWVDHLRRGEPQLIGLLGAGEVLTHPFIIGELACGNLQKREEVLGLLSDLPSLGKAGDREILQFVSRHRLQGRGLGLVDMHLLAACALARRPLWTRDTRLGRAASQLGLALD